MKGPEWKMEEEEARRIAVAAQNVARHYDIRATQKAIDFAALGSVLMWSYGTRLTAMGLRRRVERAAEEAAAAPTNGAGDPANVYGPQFGGFAPAAH